MSGANDRQEIQGFLQEHFDTVEEGAGVVTAVLLMHIAHAGEVELHSMKPGHSKWNNAEAMAAIIDSIATRHARGVVGGGAQQYQLALTRGTDSRPCTVLPFVRVSPSNVIGPSGSLATEPPTALGIVQQGQRQQEGLHQTYLSGIQHLQHSQQTALDARDRKIEQQDRMIADLWLGLKGAILELQEKRHAEKMQELAAGRAAEFQRQVMALAPALINMMAGKEVFPLLAADTALIDGIAAGCSIDDLRMVSTVLAQRPGGDKLAAILTDRFEKYHKRLAAERAEEARLMRELPGRSYDEAEADAMGQAIRALRGQPLTSGPPSNGVRPKALANGHTNGGATDTKAEPSPLALTAAPSVAPSEDGALLGDIFGEVPDEQLGMLIAMLGAQKPELAERLKKRLESFRAGVAAR